LRYRFLSLLFFVFPLASPAVENTFEIVDPRLPDPLPYKLFRPPTDGDTRLPALLLLHGHGGSQEQWDKAGAASATAQRLIDEGVVVPHILVMPGVRNSWYVNSDSYGAVADVLLDRLLGDVEARFGADPQGWAVAGLSMGGYGALRLGFSAPERFSFIGALSPAIFAPDARFGEVQYKLFNSAFGEPFDRQRYEAASPFGMLGDDLPPIYLATGDDDFFGLEIGTVQLYLELRARGHKPELRVRDAGHSWPLWRSELELMLRKMLPAP